MPSVRIGATFAAVVSLCGTPVVAQGRGNAQPHGSPHATTTTQSGAHAPATPHSSGSSKPTTTTTSTSTGTSSTSTGTTSGSGSTTTTTTTNPIATKIQSHPQLASKVTTLLKGTGLTIDQASTGFRNQGQFIAALHVSQNLHIPFADLQKAMVGTSTTPGMSLGQAIHKLRPTADADGATQTATTQANGDLSGK